MEQEFCGAREVGVTAAVLPGVGSNFPSLLSSPKMRTQSWQDKELLFLRACFDLCELSLFVKVKWRNEIARVDVQGNILFGH